MIQNWMQKANAFLDDILYGLSHISRASIAQRWQQIKIVFESPRENPGMLLAFGGLGILVILAVLVAIVLIILTVTKKRRAEEYEYVFIDEEGNETVVQSDDPLIALDKPTDPLRFYRRAIAWACCFIGLWLLLGVSTQANQMCTSCHTIDESNEAMVAGGHQKVRCVACHESGNLLQTATVGLVPRVAHLFAGLKEEGSSSTGRTYQAVSSRACLRCHNSEDIASVVAQTDYNRIRVSHRHSLDAGISCTTCHTYTQRQTAAALYHGMQVCVTCHDGTRASASCDTCHVFSPAVAGKTQPSPKNANILLAHTDPQQECYRCHDGGSCDACHGLRVPHSAGFMDIADSPQIHANAASSIGAQRCIACHISSSPSGIAPCTDCHGGTETNPTFP